MIKLLSFAAVAAAALAAPDAVRAAGNAPQPAICARGCWGASAPSGSIAQMAALTRAIVHHTAGNEFNTTGYEASKANVRAIQAYHKNTMGWGDIAYHFLVDKFGNTFEGRSGSMTSLPRGTHDGTNTNSFGFNCMGYFHPGVNNVPTAPMMTSLYNVIAWRMPSAWRPHGSPGVYGPLGNAVGYVDAHRRVKSTACPGDGIFNPYMGGNVNAGVMRDEILTRINGVVLPPAKVQQQVAGDFDGDGKDDIAWRKTGWGNWVVDYGSGAVGAMSDGRGDFNPAYLSQVAYAGDFNGDGKSDIAWRKTGWPEWFLNMGGGGTGTLSDSRGDFNPNPDSQTHVAGDFDNDGKSDIAWRKTGWPEWNVNYGSGAFGVLRENRTDFDPGTDQAELVADVDGDGRDDIAWRKTGWPEWLVNLGTGASASRYDSRGDFNANPVGQTELAGDFDGDGKGDLAWRKTGWTNWNINFGTGGFGTLYDSRTDFSPNPHSQTEIAGDFNNDGRTDIAYRKAAWPEWFISFGNGATGTLSDGRTDFNPSNGHQVTLGGDINGDSRTDLAWRKTGWGEWFVNSGAGGGAVWTLRDNRSDFNPSGL